MPRPGMTTEKEKTMTRTDICCGPIAPGQFFIDRMNPECPQFYKTTGLLVEGVFYCDMWGMNENRCEWTFGVRPTERGIQIAQCNLERMQRVTATEARHAAEKELRRRDDEWRAQYDPTRDPIKIVRCTCGVGDCAGMTRHAVGCFCRMMD